METGELLACHVGTRHVVLQRRLFSRERSRAVSARKKRVLTGEAWQSRIDGISKLPFWYNLDTGEAMWDTPAVVMERELHKRALERRYAGIPQPLLLRVLSFLPTLPERFAAARVSSTWAEGALHDSFNKKVLPVEADVQSVKVEPSGVSNGAPAKVGGGMGVTKGRLRGGPHLEEGSFTSLAEALASSEAGDTIVLGPGHHWEGDLNVDKSVRLVGDKRDPARVVLEITGGFLWSAGKGLFLGLTLRRPKPCPLQGALVSVSGGGKLQMTSCHVGNKGAALGAPALSVVDQGSVLFLEKCNVDSSPGPGILSLQGGSVALAGCEVKGSGGAGVEVGTKGKAVLNDSYIYWNGGAGVAVLGGGVVSLEHNDCSHNKLGPVAVEKGGSVKMSRGNHCVVEASKGGMPNLPEGFRPREAGHGQAPYSKESGEDYGFSSASEGEGEVKGAKSSGGRASSSVG
ncbi:unnamed protein product, partial [Choristocarpus tenellus]